jgi:EAL domain-containing protein (putative c-di-GMP-specific phosphodiesterase class I)
MAPDEFIPIAEHTGLIGGLTTLVLDQGLAQWRQWNARGIELSIAVNVSARSLTDDDIVDHVSRALVRHRCPSDVLTIEITETQLMSDPEHAAATLNHLHDLGVRISIDDFGTGFSSLSSLRALPIGEVKIDKSFTFGATHNESDATIVRSIAALGRELGMHVVAEGVETEEAVDFVRASGANTAQGYYFSRPVPAPTLEAWLAQTTPVKLNALR